MPGTKEHPVFIAVALAALDTLGICAAYLAGCFLTAEGASVAGAAWSHLPYLGVMVFVWFTVAGDQRLLASQRSSTLLPQLFTVTKAVFISAMLTVFLLALFIREGVDRHFVLTYVGAMLLTILVLRILVRLSIWDLRRRGYNSRRVLLIGVNRRTAHLIDVIQAHGQYGYHMVGALDDDADPERLALLEPFRIPYLGAITELEKLLANSVVDLVYIALPLRSYYERIREIAHLCEGIGVPVRLIAEPLPLRTVTSDVVHIGDIQLLSLSRSPEAQTEAALKRAIESVASSILLLMLAPLLLLVALLIKLESRGPVFSTQEETGRNRRPFMMLRFRTRHENGAAPARSEMAAGETAAGTEPHSLTRIGRLLQRYGLDELPQLINVWRGQMSLLGSDRWLQRSAPPESVTVSASPAEPAATPTEESSGLKVRQPS